MKIDQIAGDISSIKLSMKSIEEKNIEMFNHFTETYQKMFENMQNRIPGWILAVGAIGGTVLGALAIWALTN